MNKSGAVDNNELLVQKRRTAKAAKNRKGEGFSTENLGVPWRTLRFLSLQIIFSCGYFNS